MSVMLPGHLIRKGEPLLRSELDAFLAADEAAPLYFVASVELASRPVISWEDRASGRQAKVRSITELQEAVRKRIARRKQRDAVIEYTAKGSGGLVLFGCAVLVLLTAATGVGLIWKLFTWVWGL